MQTKTSFFLTLLLLGMPANVFAATAGTDDDLRSIGYTDAQLEARVATEDREAFELGEGAGRVDDPLGDVLERWGNSSDMHEPWGDIREAIVTKNNETQTWDVTISLGGAAPEKPTVKTQYFVYFDTDDDKANNATQGVRIGTDAEFSLQYNQEHGWYTDFRWYNADADFWASNKETASTYTVGDRSLTLHIPFAEAPETLAPHWRVAMGLANGSASQLDVVPGTGFPPPKGETYPTSENPKRSAWPLTAGAVITLAILGGIGMRVAKKRRK